MQEPKEVNENNTLTIETFFEPGSPLSYQMHID